jgi:hypothetical protein
MVVSTAASRVAVIMSATRGRIAMFTVVVWLRMSGAAVRVSVCARTGRSKHHRACVRRLVMTTGHWIDLFVFVEMPTASLDEVLSEGRKHIAGWRIIVFWQNDDSAEQAAVHALADVMRMIVEGPRADHVVGNVEAVRPGLSWANLIRPAAVGGLSTERPGSIRICAIQQPVHMETVRDHVAIEHVDVESLAGTRVEYGSRDSVCVDRFVYIREH